MGNFREGFKPAKSLPNDVVSRNASWADSAVAALVESGRNAIRMRCEDRSTGTQYQTALKAAVDRANLNKKYEASYRSGWVQVAKKGITPVLYEDGELVELGAEYLEGRGFKQITRAPGKIHRQEWSEVFDEFLASDETILEFDSKAPAYCVVQNYSKKHPECPIALKVRAGKSYVVKEGK